MGAGQKGPPLSQRGSPPALEGVYVEQKGGD